MFKGPLKRVNAEKMCASLLIWEEEAGRDMLIHGVSAIMTARTFYILMQGFDRHTARKKNSVFARYLPRAKTTSG